MQYLMYSIEQNPETSAASNPEMMAEMGKFIQEAMNAGVVVTTGGLEQTGTRLRLSGGKVSVTDGASITAKELIGGFAVLQVNSKEEAIEWATRFRKIVGDGESEIVQVYGPG